MFSGTLVKRVFNSRLLISKNRVSALWRQPIPIFKKSRRFADTDIPICQSVDPYFLLHLYLQFCTKFILVLGWTCELPVSITSIIIIVLL